MISNGARGNQGGLAENNLPASVRRPWRSTSRRFAAARRASFGDNAFARAASAPKPSERVKSFAARMRPPFGPPARPRAAGA